MKGKGEMVTFWVEDKANRTPPMEDELKVSRCRLKVIFTFYQQGFGGSNGSKEESGCHWWGGGKSRGLNLYAFFFFFRDRKLRKLTWEKSNICIVESMKKQSKFKFHSS